MAKEVNWKIWFFFSIFLFLMIYFGLEMTSFGEVYFYIQAFISGIVMLLLFFSMVYALRYGEKAAKIMIVGLLLLLFVEVAWFLSSVFNEYYLLKLNPIVLTIETIGIFTLLYGFKEAMR